MGERFFAARDQALQNEVGSCPCQRSELKQNMLLRSGKLAQAGKANSSLLTDINFLGGLRFDIPVQLCP